MIDRTTAIVALAFLFLWSGTASAERTVVLIANQECPVVELSNLDIRKAYLGLTVRAGDQAVRPLRLVADAALNRVFFQNIVAMSEKSYARRALSLALKFGTPRPAEFPDLGQALRALQKSTCGILFLWEQDVPENGATREIGRLWQGT
jgi:hypothetical protein